MVKSSFYSTKLYDTPKECIEAQMKEGEIVRCYYFFHDSSSLEDAYYSSWGKETTPEEMVELAVEQFNKYGYVAFNGVSKDNTIFYLGCYDESAKA